MPRLRLSRLVRLASLHVAAVVVAASLAFPRSSTAQAPCNRACDAAQRDVNGCCSAAPPSQDKTSATTMPCRPGMAQVDGGTFTTGARGATVTVAPLCMDLTEVTVDAYVACIRTGLCTAAHVGEMSSLDAFRPDTACNHGVAGRGNHPMNCVDWAQSAAYCQSQAKRLPTEEEWEWAARGGPAGRTYPWGSATPDIQACWSGLTKRVGTCPVGASPAGDAPGGIHDLAGNVSEWTSTENGSEWPAAADQSRRVFRGGSWHDAVEILLRSSTRPSTSPQLHDPAMGFRCVTATAIAPR